VAWPFVGRTEQLKTIRTMLGQPHPGPIIVSGEPSAGRTSLLIQALDSIDLKRDVPVVVGDLPGAPDTRVVAADPAAVTRQGNDIARIGRRAVFVLDDAHRADHAVVEAMRDQHREHGAVLLVSRAAQSPKPDPLDCLRYEAGVLLLSLTPLAPADVRSILNSQVGGLVHAATAAALHAATGGNPGLLHALVHVGGLAADMTPREGTWQLAAGAGRPLHLSGPARHRLLLALDQAWSGLALDHVVELGRVAVRAGLAAEAVPMLAFALLLRGEAEAGLRLVDGVDEADQPDGPAFVRTKALLLAFGLGRVDAAVNLLTRAGSLSGPNGRRLLAARAWILATVGQTNAAIEALTDINVVGDQATAVFAHGAAAAIHLNRGRPRQAVSQLRRAIIVAGTVRTELPWLAPYLTGALADALLFAGRISEATVAAAEFHAAHEGSGWDVTVSLSALIRGVANPVVMRSRTKLRDTAVTPVAVGFTATATAPPASTRDSQERGIAS
jgi:hypothetical protein